MLEAPERQIVAGLALSVTYKFKTTNSRQIYGSSQVLFTHPLKSPERQGEEKQRIAKESSAG